MKLIVVKNQKIMFFNKQDWVNSLKEYKFTA